MINVRKRKNGEPEVPDSIMELGISGSPFFRDDDIDEVGVKHSTFNSSTQSTDVDHRNQTEEKQVNLT